MENGVHGEGDGCLEIRIFRNRIRWDEWIRTRSGAGGHHRMGQEYSDCEHERAAEPEGAAALVACGGQRFSVSRNPYLEEPPLDPLLEPPLEEPPEVPPLEPPLEPLPEEPVVVD